MSTEPTKVPELAASGDKSNILTNSGDGVFTVAGGFGLRLSQDLFPKRIDFNGLFNLLSKPLSWFCKGGFFAWDNDIATGGGYPIRAIVKATDNSGYYSNLVDNNTSNPNTGGANWEFIPTDIVLQAEAEAGTATTPRMWNALRVKQAIAAWNSANVSNKVDVQQLVHTTYYDVNSDSWADITDLTLSITVSNAPVKCDFEALVSAFYNQAAYATYFQALLNGGEHTNTVVDFCSTDGMGATSNITNTAVLKRTVTLAQNTTYTFKIQAKNSATAPAQNCRINASNDYLTSADPGNRSLITLRTY